MMRQRACIRCGDSVEGRVDKVYCTPSCKSAHHYQKNRDSGETLYKSIDHQLKLNRRLLKHFNQAGKSTIRSNKLIEAGFNPNYFTHYWKNSKGQVYLFCYDVGFLKLKERGWDKYLLIEWQDYMTPGGKGAKL